MKYLKEDAGCIYLVYSVGTKATRLKAAVHYASHSLSRGNVKNLMPRSFTFVRQLYYCSSKQCNNKALRITFNSCKIVSTYSMAPATETSHGQTCTYDSDITLKTIGKCIQRQYDTRNHRFALQQSHIQCDMRKFIPLWNSLPDYVVSSPTLNTFKARLDKFWVNQEVHYNWKADILYTGSRSNVELMF